MKLYIVLVITGLAALLALPTQAKPPEFEPAAFRTDKFSLAQQISFPWEFKEGQDFHLSVACTVHVTRRGRLRYPFCLGGNDESRNFERRIILAAKRARMVPARVNGKLKPVTLKFTTIYRRVNGEASVTVVPNHFLNNEEFGVSYSAPQLLTSDTRGYPFTCSRMKVIMKISVDSGGVASDAHLHLGDPKATSCIQAISKRTHRLRYLPGMVNGVPTTMDHLYLAGWRGGWTVYGGTR